MNQFGCFLLGILVALIHCYCASCFAVGQQTGNELLLPSLSLDDASTYEYDVYTNELPPCHLTIGHLSLDHEMPDQYLMDTALLYVVSSVDFDVVYRWQHGDCYECPLFEVALTQPDGANCSQRIQTKYPNVMEVAPANGSGQWSVRQRLTDRGVYRLDISSSNGQDIECSIQALNNPPNPDLPLLYAFLIYAALAAIWVLLVFLYKKGKFDRILRRNKMEVASSKEMGLDNDAASKAGSEGEGKDGIHHQSNEKRGSLADDDASAAAAAAVAYEKDNKDGETGSASKNFADADSRHASAAAAAAADEKPKIKQRLRSLDAFRGLSLVVMIFVNCGSAGYYYIDHAIWNGLTVGDLVFPWFIFMMGTSMAFAFRGLFKRNTSNLRIIWKIVWRSVLLFAMGIFLGTKYENDLEWLRIPGVLQRFSVTYLVTALVYFPFAKRALKKPKSLLGDVFYYWPEWIIHLALLALQLALTFALPVPNCPTGYLGPGGLANNASHWNCTGGAAGYIDRKVLSEQHIYRYPTIKGVYYNTQAFDPEGILGTLTSIFLCFLGLQAGKIIDMHKTPVQILVRWFFWAVLTGLLALLLSNAKQDGGWVPLNKNLWSVSYILAMASTAFIALSLMYICIDLLRFWNGSPFIYPGMNSIVIYFCQSSFSTNFPVSWQMPDPQSHWQELIVDCWSASFWTFVAYILYRKKIFVAL